MLGFAFHEVMEGSLERPGERFDRPFRFEFDVKAPSVASFFTSVTGALDGTVRIDGLARDAKTTGTLELSPFGRGTLRYGFAVPTADGKRYRFEGVKFIDWLDAVRTWTTLPGVLYDEQGKLFGTAILRFSLRRHLPDLLRSLRLVREPCHV